MKKKAYVQDQISPHAQNIYKFILGSETFNRAGAGAYKLQTFLLELDLELRVLVKNVGAKSGAAKIMFHVILKTHLKLYFSNIFLVLFKFQQYRKLTLKKGFSKS